MNAEPGIYPRNDYDDPFGLAPIKIAQETNPYDVKYPPGISYNDHLV